jgi:hypothetical protein
VWALVLRAVRPQAQQVQQTQQQRRRPPERLPVPPPEPQPVWMRERLPGWPSAESMRLVKEPVRPEKPMEPGLPMQGRASRHPDPARLRSMDGQAPR